MLPLCSTAGCRCQRAGRRSEGSGRHHRHAASLENGAPSAGRSRLQRTIPRAGSVPSLRASATRRFELHDLRMLGAGDET